VLFSSLEFVCFFFPLFFILYYSLKKIEYKNLALFLGSIIFYVWGELKFFLLMLSLIVINFFLTKIITNQEGKSKKCFLGLTVSINLLALIIFKYAGFIVTNLNNAFNLSMAIPAIVLPLGISFYIFQLISYDIDIYRGNVPVQKNFICFGAYISAFPQLIAGPIVKYRDICNELYERKCTLNAFVSGIERFIFGLGKKVLIANTLGYSVDLLAKSSPAELGCVGGIIIMFAFTLQIYFDFSGYSDMSIGMGKMMGFNYPENFDHPFSSKSIQDFWKHWHMSLTSFFREYVYIPLGGNRCSKLIWVRNILIVWAITGIWHGASWNFLLWGLYFGIFIILEKLVYGKVLSKLPVINSIYTIILFSLSMVLFRFEDSLAHAGDVYNAIFGKYGLFGADKELLNGILMRSSVNNFFWLIFIIGFIGLFRFEKIRNKLKSIKGYEIMRTLCCITILMVSLVFLISDSYNPFIYFNF